MLSLRWRDTYATATNITNEFESIIAQFKALWLAEHNEDGTHLVEARELALTPVGAITAFGGTSAPDGWVLCNGDQVSRVTYQGLFSIIGTTYGAGDGSTTFNLPDLRQRFPLGKAAAGTGSALAATGGAIDHTHTGASHTHGAGTLAAASHTHAAGTLAGPSHSHSIPNQAAHTHTVSGSTANESAHTHDSGSYSADETTSSSNNTASGLDFGSPVYAHTHDIIGTSGAGSAHSHTAGTLAADSGGSHDHGGSTGSSGTGSVTGSTAGATASVSGSTASDGGGATGANNPPFLVINYIIYTGIAA